MSGQFFCLNVLTDPVLNEPCEPLLHARITCQDCGDSFVKNPDEWLKDARSRHCHEIQQ